MKLPLKTVSMRFMLFIAISSLFLSPVSAEDAALGDQPEASEGEVFELKLVEPEKLRELTEEFRKLELEFSRSKRPMVFEDMIEKLDKQIEGKKKLRKHLLAM